MVHRISQRGKKKSGGEGESESESGNGWVGAERGVRVTEEVGSGGWGGDARTRTRGEGRLCGG